MKDGKNDRYKQRFENFCNAMKSIEDVLPRYISLSILEKDGLIQRFEFTFELAWKLMQDYLLSTGYKGLKGPRNVIKQMGQDGLIDPFVWQEIIEARNELSHMYSEKKSRAYLDKIVTDYFPVMQAFKAKMTEML